MAVSGMLDGTPRAAGLRYIKVSTGLRGTERGTSCYVRVVAMSGMQLRALALIADL